MIFKKVLYTFLFIILLIKARSRAQSWTESCLQECECDQYASIVHCYSYYFVNASDNPQVYQSLDYKVSNRSFKAIYLHYFKVPASAFSKVQFNLSDISKETNRSRIYISFVSSSQVFGNAFNPFGQWQNGESFSNKNVQLDIDFITPLAITLNDFAFNDSLINRLRITTLRSSAPYKLNINSFYGAKNIDSFTIDTSPQIVDFVSKPISGAPKGVIRTISITGINMTAFTNTTFNREVIAHDKIENFALNACGITSIGLYIFAKMSNVKTIDLGLNKISAVEEFTFYQEASSLELLDLSNNQITYIHINAFKSLKALKELRLKATNITNLPLGVLRPLESSLVTLDLALSRQFQSLNWHDLIQHLKLSTLSLSYMRDREVFISRDKDDALEFNALLQRLSFIKASGYNFTHADICKLQLSDDNSKNSITALFQLNREHSCNCFVIQVYQFYRQSNLKNTSLLVDLWLNYAPQCYKSMYSKIETTYSPTKALLDLENTCRIQLKDVCSMQPPVVKTTTVNNEKASTGKTTESGKWLSTEALIGILVAGVLVAFLIVGAVIYKINTGFRIKKLEITNLDATNMVKL